MQCTATSKQSKRQCRRLASIGRNVCYLHGGKSLVGIASPTYKHGRYSVAMPTALVGKYQQAQGDTNLLGIREDIALQDALVMQALESMERGEAGELWSKLKEAARTYHSAKKKRDGDGDAAEALSMVFFLINEGYLEYMSRIELRQMLQERSRLVEAESRRLERAQQTVTVERVLMLMDRLAEIVSTHVSDRATLAAIASDFRAITGGAVRVQTDGNG